MAVPYKVCPYRRRLGDWRWQFEAGQVNVVHVSSFSGKVVFSKTKAEYGNASRVITWRILYLCFGLGFTTASIKT